MNWDFGEGRGGLSQTESDRSDRVGAQVSG